MSNILTVRNLSLWREHWRRENLSFCVQKGEIVHIIGDNGCGKSTLLKALLGIFPYTGQLDNHATKTHFIGHQLGIKTSLTVAENLEMMLQLFDQTFVSATELTDVLANLCLPANYLARDLSQGQRQKLALARLWAITKSHNSSCNLSHDNVLWLLDEPFAHLDQPTCAKLLELFSKHSEASGAVIFTSHYSFATQSINTIDLNA